MNISGWGNNLHIQSKVYYPKNKEEIVKLLKEKKMRVFYPEVKAEVTGM